MVRSVRRLSPLLLALVTLAGCGRDALLPRELAGDRDVREFAAIAEDPDIGADRRFAALEPLISRYRDAGAIDQLNALLSRVLEDNPGDPYGAYYLMALAENAREAGALPLAQDYWRRLLSGYPDLDMGDRSLHLLAMRELAKSTEDPREAASLYEDMIRRFPDRIEQGRTHYVLSKDLAAIGDWDGYYRELAAFLADPDARIPGEPDARTDAKKALAFRQSDKSWTVEDLDTLVSTIKYAIRTLNGPLLKRYQADDFFLMSWSQQESDDFVHIDMDLSAFLKSSIVYRSHLEPFSSDREAYLWTQNWSYRIPIWYLCFRKVDYPADPEINGRWEWAGIYFGERL